MLAQNSLSDYLKQGSYNAEKIFSFHREAFPHSREPRLIKTHAELVDHYKDATVTFAGKLSPVLLKDTFKDYYYHSNVIDQLDGYISKMSMLNQSTEEFTIQANHLELTLNDAYLLQATTTNYNSTFLNSILDNKRYAFYFSLKAIVMFLCAYDRWASSKANFINKPAIQAHIGNLDANCCFMIMENTNSQMTVKRRNELLGQLLANDILANRLTANDYWRLATGPEGILTENSKHYIETIKSCHVASTIIADEDKINELFNPPVSVSNIQHIETINMHQAASAIIADEDKVNKLFNPPVSVSDIQPPANNINDTYQQQPRTSVFKLSRPHKLFIGTTALVGVGLLTLGLLGSFTIPILASSAIAVGAVIVATSLTWAVSRLLVSNAKKSAAAVASPLLAEPTSGVPCRVIVDTLQPQLQSQSQIPTPPANESNFRASYGC